METGLWPPAAPPRGAAAALSFVGRRPPDFKLAGASGRGAGHGPPRAPSLGWPSTPVSCQGDLPSEAAGGHPCGRRAGSKLGGGPRPSGGPGLAGRGRGTVSCLCLCTSCLLGGGPTAAPQCWTRRWTAAWTSSWWAPASCRRPLHQSPAEVRARQAQSRQSGCQPRAGQL